MDKKELARARRVYRFPYACLYRALQENTYQAKDFDLRFLGEGSDRFACAAPNCRNRWVFKMKAEDHTGQAFDDERAVMLHLARCGMRRFIPRTFWLDDLVILQERVRYRRISHVADALVSGLARALGIGDHSDCNYGWRGNTPVWFDLGVEHIRTPSITDVTRIGRQLRAALKVKH